MKSRLEYLRFPKLDESKFKDLIDKQIFDEVKLFNKNFKTSDQLKVFVDHLDSDLRTFALYCESFNGKELGN